MELDKMKGNKAAGQGGIVIETLPILDVFRIDKNTEMINVMYDSGEIPEDVSRSVFREMLKKQLQMNANSIGQSV